MKRNRMAVRLVSLLLLSAMLVVSFAACGKKKSNGSETVTTKAATVDYPFLFDSKDYNEDFVFLHANNLIYEFVFADASAGSTDLIESALFERDALVEQYLGVSIKSVTKEEYDEILPAVETQILSGVISYDAVLTHSYLGVTGLISRGYLADFGEMYDIDLEADWWNYEAIETLAVKGKNYLALNDFVINDPCAVFFNKDMLEQYADKDDPYELVRSGNWTLENLIKITSDVYYDASGNNARDKEDVYGFAAMADWPFLSLIDSCDVQWLSPAGSGYRALQMGDSNERYSRLYDQVMELANAESTYLWNYGKAYEDDAVKITNNREMFMFTTMKAAYNYRGSEVRFGILPYPKLDADQKEYKTFDWSGMLCVPKSVDNMTMVAQTLDCLAYFATDTIRPAYYEKLLGTRLAESPDDAEMIVDYVYGTIVLNPVFNFIEKANTDLGVLAYTLSKALRAKLNNEQILDITANWNTYRVPAQAQLDKFLN